MFSEEITAVKRPSSCVSKAILVQLKCLIVECKAGDAMFMFIVFLKYRRNLLLSLREADVDAYEI